MTIAPDAQRADRERMLLGVLTGMPEVCCFDDWIIAVADMPTVQYDTTWRTATGDGLLTPHHDSGGPRYALSGAGWLLAMRLSGRFDDDATRSRCSELMAFLKKRVDDAESPHADQIFEWQYDGPAGIPNAWNYNALASGLLAELFDKHRINIYRDPRNPGQWFRVPADFGRKLIG